MRKYFLFLIILSSPLFIKGQILYEENFSTGSWPTGWNHEGNWEVSSSYQGNDTPPAALFNWSPQAYNFEQSATTPLIDVGDNEGVLVEFYFALDFYGQGELNGLKISYNGGGGWIDVLSYAIGPGLTIQNNPWTSTESFTADISSGNNLQVRWTAYGTNSWAIDGWIVDNIKFYALPKLTSVAIQSSNEDPTSAITGTDVSLNFTANTSLAGNPYVQINGNACSVSNTTGTNWVASYTVQSSDPDGPLQFTIDFTSANGIDGKTVKQTIGGSKVIVDNSDPPPFTVGVITSSGGTVAPSIWNSTNTAIGLEVNVPQDSAVASFNYYQGNSLQFDGNDDEVSIIGNSYQSLITNTLTIESWVKPGVAPVDYDGFLSYAMDAGGTQAGFGFSFYLTGWRFFLKTTSNQINYGSMAGSQMPVGQWSHIAATYDGSEVKLYRNGALVDSADAMGNVKWSGAPAEMVLGNFPKDGAGHFFQGSIDEVRLWNIVRTKDQLKASREINLTGEEAGLIGYWRIDEGSGNSTADSTATANHASINGANWVTLDSPIEFKDPVYDTGVIVGSSYQLRGRIGTNSFAPFGEKDTITIADFNNGTKVISEPENVFEALIDFAHGDTAQLSALLFDAAGNFSMGDTSATNIVIDLQANNPNPVSITSNNTFTHLAKTGDVINIIMTYDEDVDVPLVTVNGNDANESDLGGEQFGATYTLLGSEPEGDINYITIVANDYLDNPGTYNGGAIGAGSSSVRYDRTLPELLPVSIISDNSDTEWAKVGDVVTISATSTEALISNTVTVVTQPASTTNTNTTQFNFTYTFTDNDPEGLVVFDIAFSDSAGNDGSNVINTTDNSKVTFDKTSPADFTVGTIVSTGGNAVENSWNSTNTGLSINIPIVANDTTLQNGRIQLWAKVENNNFTAIGSASSITASEFGSDKLMSLSAAEVEALAGFSEEDSIYIKAVMFDRPGNDTEGSISSDRFVIDQILPAINTVSYASNFTDSTLATVGHAITVTFNTESLLQIPTIVVSGNAGAVTAVSGDSSWAGTYTMQDGDTEGVIAFTINGLVDLRGNPADGFTQTTDNTVVTFDNTKPTLDPVTIISSNLDPAWAKVGDTVTVTFTGAELLTNQAVTIANQVAEITDMGGEQYSGKYVMAESDNEGVIGFKILVIDSVGLVSDTIVNTTNTSQVIFDKTAPTLTLVHIESNNANNSVIAIAGDEVYLSFTPIEPIIADSISVIISGQSVVPTLSGDTYTATITLDGTEPSGILSYTINFVDRAGNPGIQVISTTDESFVNHDTGPPEVVSTGIYSSNTDSSWAKIGDTVFVRFTANEPLNNCTIIIDGSNSIVSNSSSTTYMGYIIMSSSNDEKCIPFNVTYADLGGLTGPDADSTTNGSKVCFDKTSPVISMVNMKSNNIYGDSLAKTGDTDTLSFSISEPSRTLTVSLAGSDKVPEQSGLNFKTTHTFGGSETEGWVPFSLFMDDSAGNESGLITNTNDGSKVRFDRTIPTVPSVLFYSNNSNDTSLCITADTIFVKYTPSELLKQDSTVITIAENPAIEIVNLGGAFIAKYEMSGIEEEGYLNYTIAFQDLVGNTGIQIDTTHGTNSSYVLFDQSPPADFRIDTLFSMGGIIEEGYWNSSNDTLTIAVPIAADDESLIDGSCQLLASINSGPFINAGSGENIISAGMLNLRLSRDLFVSLSNYAEGANVQFSARLLDRAGNTTTGTAHDLLIHIDETPPNLSDVLLSSNNEFASYWAKIGDQVTLNFHSSEGLKHSITILNTDSLDLTFSNSGLDWTGTRELNNNDPEGQQTFTITYRDTAGNTGDTVSVTSNGQVIILDKTDPNISGLLEGTDTMDLDYYNRSDSLSIYWVHQDAFSGIRDGFVSMGSDSLMTDIVAWSSSAGESKSALGTLNLANDNDYFTGVFVKDSAGNHSDTIWSDGIYIDLARPDTGFIMDGQWIMDADYTPDSTTLKYTWSGFSDNTEIDYYQLAIGTGNDTTNILDWFNTDSTDSITIRNLNLQRDTLYFTYIRAVDIASNFSFTTSTDGVYFDNKQPFITDFTPDVSDSLGFLSILRGDTITIKFNRPIYSYKVAVNSRVDTQFVSTETYSDSVITIVWQDTLTSYDTVTVFIDSAFAINTLYVTDTLQFFSRLWGDLNDDYDITVADILAFNDNWPNTDLGPFLGEPPHVKPKLDSQANLTDLKAFAKMWQWRYHSLDFDTALFVARNGNIQNLKIKDRTLKIFLPSTLKMGEILIGETNLDINNFHMIDQKSSTFLYTVQDTVSKMKLFSLADKIGLDNVISIHLPNTNKEYFHAKVQYRFMDENSQIQVAGMESIATKLVPEKFTLYGNYPNPFNAETVIEYDLPNNRPVRIRIFDLLGRTVKAINFEMMKPGKHEFIWYGNDSYLKPVSSGVYFIHMQAGEETRIQKMLLLK
tara:strand:+ start:61860 stop:69134 length:7275 start_codon:yes stop_codon:yes gene_type:complete